MKWLNHKNARLVMGVFFGVCFVLMFIAQLFSDPAAWVILGLSMLCLCAGIVVLLIFWRYPHCGAMLPPREGNIRYCPHCGKPL